MKVISVKFAKIGQQWLWTDGDDCARACGGSFPVRFVEFAAENALIYGMNTDTYTQPHLTQDYGDGSAVLLTIRQAAHRLAIGRSTLYVLIAEGELEVIHIGRAVRVPADAIDAFVRRRRARGSDHAGAERGDTMTKHNQPRGVTAR